MELGVEHGGQQEVRGLTHVLHHEGPVPHPPHEDPGHEAADPPEHAAHVVLGELGEVARLGHDELGDPSHPALLELLDPPAQQHAEEVGGRALGVDLELVGDGKQDLVA